MDSVGTVSFESDWLPDAELQRLLAAQEVPGITVSTATSRHRGLDPAMAVALVSGAVALLTPFVTKLAERLFRQEPDAAVRLSKAEEDKDGDKDGVVLLSSLPEEVRNEVIATAIASGAVRVRISLEQPTT